ncbi:helix-turn-helix transcriptional regulator [Rhizobium sp. BK418]|uniref:helix-turn-helix domain-containing protein n=1 Tax=Rhizobium sp. BK418 TaxID=2512120 RepID=UPI0010CF4CDD|nr:helix-turn-helix transcriptional regulator [Rhizobium sp. BK418]TCR98620.1 helix-turn-helix protein [Rhizobium sp. BK418]
MAQKVGHPIDAIVGGNLARIRKAKGLSLSAVADALGISFQQVQKYEKGKNRISASVLFELGQALAVSVDEFFRGAETVSLDDKALEPSGRTFSTGGLEHVKDVRVRRALLNLIKTVSVDVVED